MSAELTWAIYPINEFPALAAEWDALNRDASSLPVLDSQTIELLRREFGSGKELIALCRSSGKLVAAAVLQPSGQGRWQTFQPAQAPLGAWLQRPPHSHEVLLGG